MQNLPKIETVEQARETLVGMDEGRELTATSDEGSINIKKHSDHEFSAELAEHETGIISLRDASHILLEHRDHELYLS